jgi:hypothetical protein
VAAFSVNFGLFCRGSLNGRVNIPSAAMTLLCKIWIGWVGLVGLVAAPPVCPAERFAFLK